MNKIPIKNCLHQNIWGIICWGGGMAVFIWLLTAKMGIWIIFVDVIVASGTYYMMVGRWRAIEASSFIYDKKGMLMCIARSCYVPYSWFRKNHASVEHFPFFESFRAIARCYAVGLGEILLSVEGGFNMTENPQAVFREVFRKGVDVKILTENLLKEVLLTVELPVSAEEVRDKAKFYLQEKLPNGAVTFNCFCAIRHGDRFII